MAKKRKTLREKKRASIRRQKEVKSKPISKKSTLSSKVVDEESLLVVPSKLITQDLIKTLILSVVFIGIIVVMHFYLS
ncbi:MAG: hypothetical protein ACOX6V_03235 [Patescibacteria group bacterium]|jgi:predicted GTPase